MTTIMRPYDDADLIAHLLGEDVPGLKEALDLSEDLMERFNELSQLDAEIAHALGQLSRVSDQDLVDVVTEHASPNTRLLADAHIRQNPEAKERIEALKREYRELSREGESQRIKLPTFLASPLSLAIGLRSSDDSLGRRSEGGYQSTELAAQITYRAVPLQDESFRIEGSAVYQEAPGARLRVALCAVKRRPRQEFTKPTGVFSFDKVRAGEYRLRLSLPVGVMETPPFAIADE